METTKSKAFFNFNDNTKDGEGLSEKFRDELRKSKKAIIVIALGPKKAGKSTLLNFLTDKSYSEKMEKGENDEEYFKTYGVQNLGTLDFSYKKVSVSDFIGIHEIPLEQNGYDLFFIDCKGIEPDNADDENLFLGLFTLFLGSVPIQLCIDRDQFPGDELMEQIANNITISRAFKGMIPRTISINRCINYGKYPEEGAFYPEFIDRLRKFAHIDDSDEDKISILTMPDYQENKEAYKYKLKKISKLILGSANPCSGDKLLEEIERSYNKVLTIKKELGRGMKVCDVYNNLMKEFCGELIKVEEERTLNDVKEILKEKSTEDILTVARKEDPSVNAFVIRPFVRFMGKIKKIVPIYVKNDGGNEIIITDDYEKEISEDKINNQFIPKFVDDVRKDSITKISDSIADFAKVYIEMEKDYKKVIFCLYEGNPVLYEKKAGCVTQIKLVNRWNDITHEQIKVLILPEKFKYNDGGKEIELNFIIPAGIKVEKTIAKETKNVLLVFTRSSNESSIKDITNNYCFNFVTMVLSPKSEEHGKCSYKYEKTSSGYITEKSSITINFKKSSFSEGKCEYSVYKWVNEYTQKSNSCTGTRGDQISIVCDDHKFLGKENIIKILSIQFK